MCPDFSWTEPTGRRGKHVLFTYKDSLSERTQLLNELRFYIIDNSVRMRVLGVFQVSFMIRGSTHIKFRRAVSICRRQPAPQHCPANPRTAMHSIPCTCAPSLRLYFPLFSVFDNNNTISRSTLNIYRKSNYPCSCHQRRDLWWSNDPSCTEVFPTL